MIAGGNATARLFEAVNSAGGGEEQRTVPFLIFYLLGVRVSVYFTTFLLAAAYLVVNFWRSVLS